MKTKEMSPLYRAFREWLDLLIYMDSESRNLVVIFDSLMP